MRATTSVQTIIIMRKCCPCVVRWIDIDTLYLSRKLLFQCLEGEEIVSKDKAVVEDIVVCDSMWSVIGVLRVFKKDPRLQPWPVLLPNPG